MRLMVDQKGHPARSLWAAVSSGTFPAQRMAGLRKAGQGAAARGGLGQDFRGRDMSLVSIERDGDIAIVTVDNPPVNALGQALRQGLWTAVGELDVDPGVRAVVLICAGRTFFAGADVTEFGRPPVPPHLPDLVGRLEAAAKPWIAAIHGSALGGGFELAMGCRFRIALDGAAVGLPEVLLGIVPGASGTVRTPRLAGVEAAVELVTTGRPVKAARALSLGLLDRVVTGDLREAALAFAHEALERPLPAVASARGVRSPDAAWWEAQRRAIAKRSEGEIAPLRALDCVRAAAERPFAEALALERAIFLEMRASEQAAALRHVFFAERSALRPAHLDKVTPRPIGRAWVVGGAVGAGIASALSAAGLTVFRIESGSGQTQLPGRGATTGTPEPQGGADLVILADTGLFDFVRARLAELVTICPPQTIFAVCSAALDLRQLVVGLPNPGNVLALPGLGTSAGGTLCEILALPETDPAALAAAFGLARSLGQIPVHAGPGGIRDRLLNRVRAEAVALVRQGGEPAAVEEAMRALGLSEGRLAGLGSRVGGTDGATCCEGTGAASADRPRDDAIPDRLVAAMAEEGRRLLAEGVAVRTSDIDLVAIHGLGFPRWRGGPMFAAGIR